MRNLKRTEHSTVRHAQDVPLTAITWDTITASLICAFGPYAEKPYIRLQRWHAIGNKAGGIDADFRAIASWDAPSPSLDLAVDRVLSLRHFGDDRTICLVFEGGDVVLVREEPSPGQEDVEIVGSVDTGISAAAWSPDEEVLALATKSGNVMFMTRQFDGVGETAMRDDDLASSKHVSVGWGSAATQFKGKRAKALQDPTIPQKVDEGRLSPYDKRQVQISWRGDGAFVAVSSISTSKSGERRVIRVYDRECKLDSVSEPVDGLEGALSWQPAGNLIAGIQRFNDHIDVVFFERNGLRHGEFTLQISPESLHSWATTIDLAWNSDSTVLAVSYQDRIQLWTMGNYHYYLKQEIHVPTEQRWPLLTSVTWNTSLPLRLAISSPEVMVATRFASITEAGSTVSPYDSGAVAVIDGSSIKLTALRYANVPPPMASLEPAVPSAVLDVALSQSGRLLATLRSDALDVLEWNPEDPETEHIQRGSLRFPKDDSLSAYLQVAFLGETSIFCLRASSTEYTVQKVGLDAQGLELAEYVYRGELALMRIFPRSDHGSLCLADSAARVWRLDPQELYAPIDVCQFPEPAVWVEAAYWQEKTIAFGLSISGYLYANERLLSKQVTSFKVTPAHLIFTTAQHFLKFVHAAAVDDLAVPGDDPEQDERCRMIERGARLVSVIPAISAVVLQMPRGNLETVYPRALVVARIRDCIGLKDYSTAFQICRVQRVDLNILHDYAPSQFLNNLDLFVDQVQRVDYIDQFLSQLKEEDVTQTAYKTTLPMSASGTQEGAVAEQPANSDTAGRNQGQSKVNSICDAILPVLASRMPKHLQNMVTVHLSKSPPDMEAALLLVAKLKAEHPELVERAVEHICFLADVNRLFDNALGLYNLELALLIAQQSQKDPREYLPFLQSLQQMQPLRRQFVIDNHLGRFTKALGHLHALQSFEEVKEYMTRHGLYKETLALYKYEDDKFDELMAIFAEHLEGRSQFREAGIAFEFVGQYQKALESYKAAGCWREALYCAAQANAAQPQIQALARSFADSLYESKDFLNAARLYIDYGKDVELAARTYCKGYLFAEAMRLVKSHGEDALLGSVVDAGLGEAMAESTELLADCKAQINAQVPRLRELRTKRDEDPLAYYEGTAPEDVPDNVSLAPTDLSTSASLFTRYTNRTGGGTMNTHTTRNTSKNRRREERKRARGKKGSVYEEEYLVNSLRRLIERVNSVRDDVARLVAALVRRRMWERAVAVERAMLEMLDLCKACLGEVFGAVGEDHQQQVAAGAGHTAAASAAGGDDAGAGSQEHGRGPGALAPVVLPFERLSLM